MLAKVVGYYIYRNEDENNTKSVVNGIYINREALGLDPPESMSLVLEW